MEILAPPAAVERVGFLVPRWTVDPILDRQGLPFRALSVAGALYNAGFEVVYFDQEPDLDRENRTDALLDALKGSRVVFIWMNELDPMVQTKNALLLVGRIRERYPEMPVAVGGSFVTVVPPDGLFVDGPEVFFIRGYGEESAPKLVDALRGRLSFEEVPGLVWREGRPRSNPVHSHENFRINDLILYRTLDLAPYIQRGGIFGNDLGTLFLGTGRGCAKGCSFCYWRNHETSLLEPADIVDLVAFLRRRYGVRQYHLAELDFFAGRRRPLELARLWKERVADCTWFTLVSPVDAMRWSDAEWDQLAAGGLRKLELGVESGSEEMLRRLGKRHRPADALTVTRKLLDRGIESMHNFIFGFVGETEQDRRKSLDLIRRLHALDRDRVTFSFRFFQPTWDTPMGDAAIARTPGFPRTIAEVLAYRPGFGEASTHAMGWLSPAEEHRIKELVYYFLPMVTSKLVFETWLKRSMYRVLRSAAAARLACREFRFGLDRWLFDRCLHSPLDNTYTP